MIVCEEYVVDKKRYPPTNSQRWDWEHIVKEGIEKELNMKLYRTLEEKEIAIVHRFDNGTGCPDYFYRDEQRIIFVELKGINGFLSMVQLKWLLKNQERFICRVIYATYGERINENLKRQGIESDMSELSGFYGDKHLHYEDKEENNVLLHNGQSKKKRVNWTIKEESILMLERLQGESGEAISKSALVDKIVQKHVEKTIMQ